MSSPWRVRRSQIIGAVAAVAFLQAAPPAAGEEQADAAYLAPLLNQTLENERSGIEVAWRNPATGNGGSIKIERTFYRGQQPCRDYVRSSGSGAAKIEIHGTGCRLGKSKWELEEAPPAASATAGSSTAPAASHAPPAAAGPKHGGDPPLPPRKPAVLVFTMPTRSDL